MSDPLVKIPWQSLAVLGKGVFLSRWSRWLMAPFYLGLLVTLAMLLVKFVQDLILSVPRTLDASNSEILLKVLSLIDLSLAANLVVIVMLAGWENFVAKIVTDDLEQRPEWMGHIDLGALKLKLFASLVAISGVYLLETFMHVDEFTTMHVAWQLAIHLTFVVSGLIMAWTDRVSA